MEQFCERKVILHFEFNNEGVKILIQYIQFLVAEKNSACACCILMTLRYWSIPPLFTMDLSRDLILLYGRPIMHYSSEKGIAITIIIIYKIQY